MGSFVNLTGCKYGRLTVIKRGVKKSPHAYWVCRCECGKTVLVRASNLLRGVTKSCGCIRNECMRQNGLNKRKYYKCSICGSDRHFAKGYCKSCYNKVRNARLKKMEV